MRTRALIEICFGPTLLADILEALCNVATLAHG
jgi:hypothetical protein